jgi:hypothetical protein
LVGITESTTDSLGEAYLLTRLKEVLTLKDVFWGELTKILIRGNLTGKKRGRETGTLVHTTTIGWGWGYRGAGGGGSTERGVLTLNDGITRL